MGCCEYKILSGLLVFIRVAIMTEFLGYLSFFLTPDS